MEQKFFICEHCGNIIAMVKDKGVSVMCCGQKMTRLEAGKVDASKEKHVPVFTVEGNKVYVMVGDVEHPMEEAHYIEWISLQTNKGNQRKCLNPADKPAACFHIGADEKIEAVYAYCNLHGLWKKENKADDCDVKEPDTDTNENYQVCKCNNVSYFEIIDAVKNESNIESLLTLFEKVRNTTHCSTGCGGCYNKVVAIISDVISGKIV